MSVEKRILKIFFFTPREKEEFLQICTSLICEYLGSYGTKFNSAFIFRKLFMKSIKFFLNQEIRTDSKKITKMISCSDIKRSLSRIA